MVYKRRRRVSDVIDSHGIDSIAAMRTPKRTKEKFSDAVSIVELKCLSIGRTTSIICKSYFQLLEKDNTSEQKIFY